MSAGKINLQANDGAVIGLVVPDGLISGERQIALGSNLSSLVPYHLLQGNLAVSNSTITKGFDTTLYTSGSVTTNIDMSTQWGSTAEEKFGGLIWLKDRVEATSNFLYDTIRGVTKEINSNTTDAEATLAGGLTTFNSTGFTVGADTGHNSTTNNMVSWNFQTTHRINGTTNHGQAYTCHYNPFTGFTMVKYTGSGIAGHEIPHHLGRKLGFVTVKSLTNGTYNWLSQYREGNYLYLNSTANELPAATISTFNEINMSLSTGVETNTSANQYIMYGWANSYFDESNKLIGNYEIGVYQGTGASGNKVPTRGKPAWIMVKRTDIAGTSWAMVDNTRGDYTSLADSANAQIAEDMVDMVYDGIILKNNYANWNASAGQYILLVAYDTNANGGGSYYPLASDTANVQVNNALIPLAKGIDANGVKNSIVVANETITGVTYTAGKNYLYKTDSGYGIKNIAPNYGKINPANGGDFYNVITNKWFTSAGIEITNSRNYLNHIVHADNDGGVLYVEELPKVEYKDIVKANEFRGKNACTASGSVDTATTPVTIYGVYGIASIIRTGTGTARLFFTQPMDDLGYSFKGNASWVAGEEGNVVYFTNKTLAYVDIVTGIPGTASSTTLTLRNTKFDFEITGGRN